MFILFFISKNWFNIKCIIIMWSEIKLHDQVSAHGVLVVRSITHGDSTELSFSSQCYMSGVTKVMVCDILSVGWCI